VLEQAELIYLRTAGHPAVPQLPSHAKIESFDELYVQHGDFEVVYGAIVDELQSLDTPAVYAVPGDPMIGEATVQSLMESGTKIRIVHGVSFVEPCLAAIGLDALEGLAVVDAMVLAQSHHPGFSPDQPTLVAQLASRELAAEVKLTLMSQFPDEHPVTLIHGAGTDSSEVEPLALYAIDKSDSIGEMTTLYVPSLPIASSFESLQEIVAHLRAPDGCPWDRAQTPLSLRRHLLEEAYEALEALDREDQNALREELGDLLLQIVLQAQIANESGHFSMAQVIADIQDKLVRRHPHVFGDLKLDDVDEVLRNWEHFKEQEKGARVLEGIPDALPALAQADEIQSRAARLGFDWHSSEGVIDKVHEELAELERAKQAEEQASELGDLLFAIVNYARWINIDPEGALRRANARFRSRFERMSDLARRADQRLQDLDLAELDRLWNTAKQDLG
jgi:tetrapyrrole methylase family protein/MazG family protein